MRNSFIYFIVISTIYLLLFIFNQDNIAWYFKPFLLPFLILATYKSDAFETKKWLLYALTFSWIGDIILLFASKNELYFILGLVSFLIAHILFIVLFIKQKSEGNYTKKCLFWLGFVVVLVYIISILSLLFTKLGNLKIPVFVYAFTISIMLITAIKGYFTWQKPMNILILIGALFFIVSDSFLSINKFYNPILSAQFIIMFTYLVAQYCITAGVLKMNKKN
ncbi:lysoplasmalogenase [Flavobacterium psychrophilum]|uniref:lysoplasmalogenase n=2 Tax=Flavobacterium psychrophilum TaxID=96345 RepID=UPI00073EB174|nr:lysoplasmalogenase [Flavobacterium psychrophilum]EKT3957061.1 lysoplasmalogenase [Flavobacterium psychrophilum]EKT3962872.1 lysoplasmalogenase [Flavobacterium psychrophilum]EKT4497817.1 lysoplasmalogenase [Flavobacterium psychrophilum]EKT4516447.1 lysoplasmalogenase [Flavobacterium psychrophilum]EKT4550905.1 lysoplasmalogenase [Flavobacterium psychrophilum]